MEQESARPADGATSVDYLAVEESPKFKELKRRHRAFVLPVAALFLIWYFVYVLLADYAHDFMSTPVFGNVNVNGYDGFLYSIGFLVAWLVALLLVAELLRNTGKFTMADVLSFRLKQRPVRMAAAISTLAVCFFYLLAQMAGAGGLVSLLLGVNDKVGQGLVIAVVGAIRRSCSSSAPRS